MKISSSLDLSLVRRAEQEDLVKGPQRRRGRRTVEGRHHMLRESGQVHGLRRHPHHRGGLGTPVGQGFHQVVADLSGRSGHKDHGARPLSLPSPLGPRRVDLAHSAAGVPLRGSFKHPGLPVPARDLLADAIRSGHERTWPPVPRGTRRGGLRGAGIRRMRGPGAVRIGAAAAASRRGAVRQPGRCRQRYLAIAAAGNRPA